GEGLAAALQKVAEAATMVLRAQGAGVMLADEHQVLRCAAPPGPPGRGLATAQERLGAGPALDSYANGMPVASRDVTADGRWPDLRHLIDRAAVRAVLSAPLTLPGGRPIGAIHLHSSRARDWEVGEIAATMAYAGVVARPPDLHVPGGPAARGRARQAAGRPARGRGPARRRGRLILGVRGRCGPRSCRR